MRDGADELPPGVLLTWYGDDFTGSSAVMEVLTFGGLPSVLFLDIPTEAQLARFSGCRAIGIAGVARAKDPAWMDRTLPGIYRALAAIGAPISHYKICSTLDSAPHIGSIGRAIDLGAPILGESWHPMLVAAPAIRRYQAFGNLFAAFEGSAYRLDRHPTMSRHPVTPMEEADVRRHLATQTDRPVGLVDLLALRSGNGQAELVRERNRGARIVAFDAIDEDDLVEVGRLIWEERGSRLFTVGSQGIEYALLAYWRKVGMIAAPAGPAPISPVDRILCVSGSCAPQTARQIAAAANQGFHPLRIDASQAVDPQAWRQEIERGVREAVAALADGRSPVAFTALGPDDPAVAHCKAAAARANIAPAVVNERIGEGLGTLLSRILHATRLPRAVIVGGDTSGGGTVALGAYALTAVAATEPGAALFRAHGDDHVVDGFEIALKGGQMGGPDYLLRVRDGPSRRS